MVFSKNWPQNRPQFLLHFLIHIDALMLCRKFELFPTDNFRVMSIFLNEPIFEKKVKAIAHGFFQKLAPKSLPIFITFSDKY